MRMGGPSGSPIWLFRALERLPRLAAPALRRPPRLCAKAPKRRRRARARPAAEARRLRARARPAAEARRRRAKATRRPAPPRGQLIVTRSLTQNLEPKIGTKFSPKLWHQKMSQTSSHAQVGWGWGPGWAVKAAGAAGWAGCRLAGVTMLWAVAPARAYLAGGETGPLRPPKRHAPRSHPHKSRWTACKAGSDTCSAADRYACRGQP